MVESGSLKIQTQWLNIGPAPEVNTGNSILTLEGLTSEKKGRVEGRPSDMLFTLPFTDWTVM